MTNTRPLAARLCTAAAALIAAAAVASCGADDSVDRALAADSPTSTTPGAEAAPATSAGPAPEPADAAAEPAATIQTPAIASEPLVAAAEPAAATDGAGLAAPAWNYSPLTDHASYDSVNGARMQAPNPAVIRIPRLEVDAPIIPLGLQADGSIEVPEDPEQAGWWLGGPEPGEQGPAVILGHVDSQEEGPAVFFYLRYLEAGDEIHIDRVDGSTVTYVVEHTERHDKDEFPTAAVYGPTEQPTLRLVTCGGDFDFDVRTYQENVIVFAALA